METENKISLRDVVYKQLKEDIIYGRINPGEKLLELELAKKFKVSRTPIREALLQLEKRGFITHEKNVGAVVVRVRPAQIAEYFDIIALLEKFAAEVVAAEKANKEVVSHLRNLQKEMRNCSKARNYFGYLERDQEFHTFFTKACGSETLYSIVSDLRNKIFRFLERGFTLPVHIGHYLDSHQKVINAVSQGKPSQAGRFMMDHILHAKKFILEEQMKAREAMADSVPRREGIFQTEENANVK